MPKIECPKLKVEINQSHESPQKYLGYANILCLLRAVDERKTALSKKKKVGVIELGEKLVYFATAAVGECVNFSESLRALGFVTKELRIEIRHFCFPLIF